MCDFQSCPAVRLKLGTSKAGSEAEWKKMLAAYEFKSDEEAIAYKLNPVDNLARLQSAQILLLLVYGDKGHRCRTSRTRSWSTTATRPSAGRLSES